MRIADSMTLGEIEQVEQMARASIRGLEDSDKPMGRLLIAVAVVMGRRTDPKYSWDDASALKGPELQRMLDPEGGG